MNKLRKVFIVLFACICCWFAFADDDSGRLVELKFELPFGLTNNTLALADYFVPEIVIDLSEFVEKMPSEGFVIGTRFDPSIAAKVSLKNGPMVAAKVGLNTYTRLGLSKDVFDFIANGNERNKDLSIKESIDGYFDMFGYVEGSVGFTFDKKYHFTATPALYTTVYHMGLYNSYVNVFNKLDGSFGFIVEGNIDTYSVIPVNDTIITAEYWQNYNQYINMLWMALGFDCGADFGWDISRNLKLNAYLRMPLVPSHLNEKTIIKYSAAEETSVNEIATGEIKDIEQDLQFGETVSVDYYINRPLKASVGLDYSLLGNMINCFGKVGLGIEHPFAENKEEMGVYVDYLLGARLSLLNMFKITLSTECNDMIYSQSLNVAANLKFLEIDAGISSSSSNLLSSLRGSGISVYTAFCIGF